MKVVTYVMLSCIAVTLLGMMLLLSLLVMPASAQTGPQCGPWPDVAAGLQNRYGESVLFEGTPNPGQGGVVITAKPDGTTWTALSLSPDGRIACLRAGGGGVADGVRAACGRGGLI